MKVKTNLFFILLIATTFIGCGKSSYYEKVVSFEGRSWGQDVKPTFEIDVKDVSKPYDFTLFLRTSTDYPYSNLWIFMKTEAPDGSIAREPFELKITDADGSWVGEKSGSIVTSFLHFKSRVLPVKGKYAFTIEQGITESQVNEVHDLGFRVDQVDVSN